MHRIHGLALVALVVALVGCTATGGGSLPPTHAPASATTSAPPASVPLRLGLNTVSANIAPVWVAKDEGLFAKYGIDAELVPIPGGERVVSALIAGEVPLTILAGTALVSATLGGADLAFFGSFANRLRYWLYARPEITSVQELRGKQLAITGRGGIIRRSLELALDRNGLDPNRDVTLVSVGDINQALVALLSGVVSGTMLSPPLIPRAEEEGMRMLVNTHEYDFRLVITGLAGTRGWVAQHENLTRQTLQAIAEAIAFSHREKERTKEVIARRTQTDDPALLERTYVMVAPGWERSLRVPPEALRNELDLVAADLPAARDAQPEQFYDNRFVDELERSGFLQQLGW